MKSFIVICSTAAGADEAFSTICKSEKRMELGLPGPIRMSPVGAIPSFVAVGDIIGFSICDERGKERVRATKVAYEIDRVLKNSFELNRVSCEDAEKVFENTQNLIFFTDDIFKRPEPDVDGVGRLTSRPIRRLCGPLSIPEAVEFIIRVAESSRIKVLFKESRVFESDVKLLGWLVEKSVDAIPTIESIEIL
jgi:hypothetical protein